MPSPLGKVAERSEVGRGRIPWVFPYKSPSAMHFCFAKVRTSSVTCGDTFPKGEGMTTPQILIYRAIGCRTFMAG